MVEFLHPLSRAEERMQVPSLGVSDVPWPCDAKLVS